MKHGYEVAAALVAAAVVFAVVVGSGVLSRGPAAAADGDDHDRPSEGIGVHHDLDRVGVWAVGHEDALVHVWTASGVDDLNPDLDYGWYNWTTRGDGGDVRWTTYPPGCDDESCALVDDTRDGPVTRNISDPATGAWRWRVESLTPTVDRAEVEAVQRARLEYRFDVRDG